MKNKIIPEVFSCMRIHEILYKLPKHFEPSNDLPTQGIYFFYEEGEICLHTGNPRIVRVGTHGKDRTLKQRLKNDHYNGNRYGSIFRNYLGGALLKQSGASEDIIKEWRKGRKSKKWKEFEDVERKVTEILKTKFFFRVIRVDSLEERKMFEEKIIATLSSCPMCKASENWLGKFCWNEKVRKSGLWNSNFVDSLKRMDEKDLKRLEELALET